MPEAPQLQLSAVLAEFARTLVGAFSIQEVLDRFVERVADVLPADGAGVLLFDPHAELRFVATSDERILDHPAPADRAGGGPVHPLLPGGRGGRSRSGSTASRSGRSTSTRARRKS